MIVDWVKFIYREIRYFFNDIVEGIKSYWRWRKVIWKDRPWGGDELMKIMIHKLRMDAEDIAKKGYGMTMEVEGKQMLEAAQLLENVLNDEYMDKYYVKHHAKWGTPKLNSLSDLGRDSTESKLTPSQLQQKRNEFRNYIAMSMYEERRDRQKAFSIIKKKVKHWWD